MSKFTPGPYVVINGDTYIGVGMGSHTKNPSAYKSKHLWCCNLQHDDEEALATANLMADAPALLEALKDCLDDLEHLTVMDEGERGVGRTLKQLEDAGELSDVILTARALIAKHGGVV